MTRIVTSAYRQDAARYRARASEMPQYGLSAEKWRWACQQYAEAYDELAERHERAIDAGREAEHAFWVEVRGK